MRRVVKSVGLHRVSLALGLMLMAWCLPTIVVAEPFFTSKELPDASHWLPAPPDTLDDLFTADLMCYFQGKAQRLDPARAQQAIWDASYGMYVVTRRFSSPFGQEITAENTPALYSLLSDCFYMVNYITQKPKHLYQRLRPFVYMNEHTLVPNKEEGLVNDGSFPSTHAAMGWLMALLLTEVNPDNQNALLAAGYDYGQSRVIAGFHWQSDVDAGRLAAVSLYSFLHTNERFLEQLAAAKQECGKGLSAKKPASSSDAGSLPVWELPRLTTFLPAVPDTLSAAFAADLTHFLRGASARNTNLAYNLLNFSKMLDYLFDAFGVNVSNESTPETYRLLYESYQAASNLVAVEQATVNRKRPYATFGLNNPLSGVNQLKSYPSETALMAWTISLVMTELRPSRHEQILKTGYYCGQEAVARGINWQSDARDAYLMAAALFARLHADASFLEQLSKARREVFMVTSTIPHTLINDGGVKEKNENQKENVTSGQKNQGRFSIQGLGAASSDRIIISNGKKVIVP